MKIPIVELIFTFSLLPFPGISNAQNEGYRDCAGALATGESGRTGIERATALSLLKECPSTPQIRRLLARWAQTGDERNRRAALYSLDGHLNDDILRDLINLYYDYNLEPWEEDALFSYFDRLAKPAHKSLLAPIFREGLRRNDSSAVHSLLGLGSAGSTEDWMRIRPFFSSERPLLRIAALESARRLKIFQAAADAKSSLFHSNAAVQKAAINLLAEIPTDESLDLLVSLYARGSQPDNRAQLMSALRKKLGSRRAAFASRTAVIYETASGRSKIVSVLKPLTPMYIIKINPEAVDLFPSENSEPVSGSWIQISTHDNISGWAHSSQIETVKL